MAGDKETKAAITAVRNGVADKNQEAIAARMAKQAGNSSTGSMGQSARDAFKGK